MNKIFPILMMMVGLSVTSCADWLDNEELPPLPESVTLSSHRLTMLVGDTCRLDAAFSPADYSDQSMLWVSSLDSVVSVDANRLEARNIGECNVVATSVMGLLSDTCYVKVLEPWGDVIKDQYDMVVYAAIDPSLDPEEVEIGAFYKDELRGRGERRSAHGIDYTVIRVYSPIISYPDFEIPITFRCHLRKHGCVLEFPDTIYFDGEAHGSLSNLYNLNLN